MPFFYGKAFLFLYLSKLFTMANNKHLLQTRLNSIAHYTREIQRLTQALEATRQTRAELFESLREFFPWQPGDIIMSGSVVRKIKHLENVRPSYGKEENPIYSVFFHAPHAEGFEERARQWDVTLENLDRWKIISEPKTADND